MGVLSIHNEGPPVGYGPDTASICHGLVLGEEGTSALLLALADSLQALAAMDNTVGQIVATFAGGASPERPGGKPADPGAGYARVFAALEPALPRVGVALAKYREWLAYARSATEAGRGHDFQAALEHASGGDSFETLVALRIEGLRKLQVRIQVLQRFKEVGIQMLRSYDFPGFFVLFMSPVRDLALAVNDLYGEVVRGALASHRAYCRVGDRMSEAAAGAVGDPSAALGNGPVIQGRAGAPADRG